MEEKTAKEMFEEFKKAQEAFSIDIKIKKTYGLGIILTLNFSDSKKTIIWSNGLISFEGNFFIDGFDILLKAIQKQIEELGWK